jgi:hypothetical protein
VLQTFTPADGPQPIASIDSSFSVADSEYPVIEVPSQPNAAIGGSGGVVAAVNDNGNDCVFWGDLQLDAP